MIYFGYQGMIDGIIEMKIFLDMQNWHSITDLCEWAILI